MFWCSTSNDLLPKKRSDEAYRHELQYQPSHSEEYAIIKIEIESYV